MLSDPRCIPYCALLCIIVYYCIVLCIIVYYNGIMLHYCCIIVAILLHYCVLLCIIVYYCVLLYYCILLCIIVYYCVVFYCTGAAVQARLDQPGCARYMSHRGAGGYYHNSPYRPPWVGGQLLCIIV